MTISAWRMGTAAAVLLVVLLAPRRGGELIALARTRPRELLAVGVGGLPRLVLRLGDPGRRRGLHPARLAVLVVALTGLVMVSLAARSSSTGPSPSRCSPWRQGRRTP